MEEIIIDGVDVSKCKYYNKVDYCCQDFSQIITAVPCGYTENCYYKQLKRKEEECDGLKSEIDFYLQKEAEFDLKIDNMLNSLKQAKEDVEKVREYNLEAGQQLIEMSKENEELKKELQLEKDNVAELNELLISTKEELEQLNKLHDEELLNSTQLISDLTKKEKECDEFKKIIKKAKDDFKDLHNLIHENLKLKQALQEIKEILINLKVQNSKEIQNKPTSGYYIPSEMHYGRCEARIEIADKILQKISEVEE